MAVSPGEDWKVLPCALNSTSRVSLAVRLDEHRVEAFNIFCEGFLVASSDET